MSDKRVRRGVSIYIDGTAVENSVKSIKSEMGKLVNEQALMIKGSDEYIAHARKIAQLDGILKEHKGYQAEVAKEYSKMSGAAEDFEKKSKKAFSLDSISAGINKLKGAIVGFLASFTVDKAVSEFSKLDDAQANVQKYTGLTRDEIKELNKEFDSLDTRTARIRLNELAGDAGRLGIQGRKDILDFVDAANIIDVALGEDLGADAITSIGKLSQMFGDADQMGLKQAMLSTGSAINEVAQNSNSAEPYLVDFTNRMAGVGVQADISIPKLIGYASVLDQNAQEAEKSSTALSKLIIKLYQEPAKFAQIAGLDIKEFTDLLKKDANEALLTLFDTLGKKGGLADLAPIFKELKLEGSGASATVAVLAGNIEKIRKEQKIATDAFNEGKSVIKEYDVQNNTFSANLAKQKKILLGYVTDLGERLAPMILKGASAGNSFIKTLIEVGKWLLENKGLILTLITVLGTYSIAITANTVLIKAQSVATDVLNSKTILFFKTLATNPLTAVGIAIGVVTAGIYKLVTYTTTAEQALKDFNKEAQTQSIELNNIFSAYKKANEGTKEKDRLLTLIKDKYGDYIKDLIDEEGRITDIEKAQIRANRAIKQGLALKMKNEALNKLNSDVVDKQVKALSGIRRIASNKLGDDMADVIVQNIGDMFADETKTIQQVETELESYLKDRGFDISKDRDWFNFLKDNVRDLKHSFIQLKRETKDINRTFSGVLDGVEPTSSPIDIYMPSSEDKPSPSDTGGGKDAGKGDKVAIQRKKVQDALRVLEEQHLKEISSLKERYLSGDLKTEEEYNQEVLKQQDKADADKKAKLQELLQSLTDPSLRIDIAKQIADIDAKALDRQVSNMEKRRKDLEKWNAEETKKVVTAALAQVDVDQRKEEQLLAEKRAKNQISDEQYRTELLKSEQKFLEERLRINGLTEDEIAKLRSQIDLNEGEQSINKEETRTAALDKYGLVSLETQKEAELALIQYYEDQGILSHEEALKAKALADQTYLDGLTTKASEVNDKIQMIGGNLTGAMTNFASAEESAVVRKYDKQIAAAEGNARKQKKLEEQKQKEQNAIKAKYADKQFAVSTAMTIASTAVAAMEAYKAMAGIPIVGPALGAIAAGAAIAYGASQIAVAKEQRDAAKEGYFDGGFTGGVDPRQVRGYLPDGSPVHGMEFVANRHLTANPQIYPALNLFDEAQKHGTAGSLTKADLAKALNIPMGGYMQGGFSGTPYTIDQGTSNNRYDESYERFVDVLDRLDEKLGTDFKAYVTYKGNAGIEEAQNLDKKMKRNISRS